ncbi:lasso peptide biosynthesis B2 protein [Aquirufa beregesia]|uniref:lasso peptide biosynthesis B2 protein n=1 Tax=Aquirufa beregesia TaxID=2516556 RepID=UPI00140A1905|nr:lasso peptide biosynthesis B2 protein [Aquirufa beregesia]
MLKTIFLSQYSFVLFKIKPTWIRFGQLNQQDKEDLPIDWELVKDVKFSIYAVSKWMPIQLVCRHQAHVAKILLNQYKIPFKLYIGFRQGDDKSIQGHAWTEVQGLQITGFCDPKEYVIHAVYS